MEACQFTQVLCWYCILNGATVLSISKEHLCEKLYINYMVVLI